jgi:type II secretory pathway pseudopilin PulG
MKIARGDFRRRSPGSVAGGFTLVELLAVIASIAILAKLLLPVLSKAKNHGAKATDLNNYHQIMIALHLYADDNNNALTWPNWDYGGAMPDGSLRPGWLYTPDLDASGPGIFASEVFKVQTGLLWDLLQATNVYLCPMDDPAQPRYSKIDAKVEARAQQLSSYIMNGAVIDFRSGFHSNAVPVKLSQMRPGDCAFWEADEREPFYFNYGSS